MAAFRFLLLASICVDGCLSQAAEVCGSQEVILLQVSIAVESREAGLVVDDSKEVLRRQQYYKQPMNNDQDLQYSANMTIGGQQIRGVLDTGSFELLVFSKQCESDHCQGANAAAFYDARISDSHTSTEWQTEHCFGSGCASSQLSHDDVNIGPLNITAQYFWEVLEAEMAILEDGTFQAIVGLGPPLTVEQEALDQAETMAQTAAFLPRVRKSASYSTGLAEVLVGEKTILENLGTTTFSVCLERAFAAPGYVIWNDEDPRGHPTVFNQITVAGQITWGVILENSKLKGGGEDIDEVVGCSTGTCSAILDSGTSLLAVPSQVIDRIQNILNSLPEPCADFDRLPNFEFDIGGVTHVLPPHSYIGEVTGTVPKWLEPFVPHWMQNLNMCTLLLMRSDSSTQFGPMWIVGMPFFREYYTTFDMGSDASSGPEERAIYTAPPADEECGHPGGTEAQSAESSLAQVNLARKRSLRRLDASKVIVPHKLLGKLRSKNVIL